MKRLWIAISALGLCVLAACGTAAARPSTAVSEAYSATGAAETAAPPMVENIPAAPEGAEAEEYDAAVPETGESVAEREEAGGMPGEITPEDWYGAAGTGLTPEKIEAFARRARDSVVAGDWETFAELIRYPITIGALVYEDEEAFLSADPEELFSDTWKQTVADESCHEMSASWRGIMMGNGEIWINSVINDGTNSLRITAINL